MNSSAFSGLGLAPLPDPDLTAAEAGALRSAQSHARNVRERRAAIVAHVRERRQTDGTGPTTAELVRALPYSRTTVHKHVSAMLAEGTLTRDPRTGELRAP